MVKLHEEKLAKKRYIEYWQEHAEEKEQYEARIREIEAEIKNIDEQYSQYDIMISNIKEDLKRSVPAEEQLSVTQKQQLELKKQKSELGIFDGKQKKRLTEQINTLQSQILNIENSIKQQRKTIQDDVEVRVASIEDERRPLKEKIYRLEDEKNNIQNELSRDR